MNGFDLEKLVLIHYELKSSKIEFQLQRQASFTRTSLEDLEPRRVYPIWRLSKILHQPGSKYDFFSVENTGIMTGKIKVKMMLQDICSFHCSFTHTHTHTDTHINKLIFMGLTQNLASMQHKETAHQSIPGAFFSSVLIVARFRLPWALQWVIHLSFRSCRLPTLHSSRTWMDLTMREFITNFMICDNALNVHNLKIWKDKPANRNYFPCLATKQSPDEMIRARHRSATLRAHIMELRNYPSSESQIPPQMGRTHFPPFSEWKADSAWPGTRWDLNPRPRNAQSENLPPDQDAWSGGKSTSTSPIISTMSITKAIGTQW